MALYEILAKATSEEDVKAAYIKVLGLKNVQRNLIYAIDCGGIATNETERVGEYVRTLVRILDGQGRLALFGMDGGYAIQTINYRADGNIASISNADLFVTYAYSEDGYAIGYTLAVKGGETFVRTLVRDSYRRDLVTTVHNSFDADFAYSYDALSRPVTRNADTFTYNFRSEVIGASIDGNNEVYDYDNIGNMMCSSFNSVTNHYTVNSLNQYTTINQTIEQSEQSFL